MFIPNATYTQTVQNAAASGALPDVLDFDGPNLYSYVVARPVKPIDSCIPANLAADLLPSLHQQGSYAGKTWGIGSYDSGLGLYVRPSILAQDRRSHPQRRRRCLDRTEFTDILHRLPGCRLPPAAGHEENYATPADAAPEWFTYGFSPIVWSAGGDLIDRKTYRSAEGSVNSAASVHALTTAQGWFREGLVTPDKNDDAFVRGQAPISWVGTGSMRRTIRVSPTTCRSYPCPASARGSAAVWDRGSGGSLPTR